MNTRLTVKDVRAATAYLVDPSNSNSPLFLPYLNEVLERFCYSGKWVGSIVQVTFDSSSGYITLPRGYLAVLGAQFQEVPVPTFTQFAQYIEGGYGQLDATAGQLGALYDEGDGFCTQADITTAGTLRIKINDANDAGLTVRIFGEDADGEEIFEDGVRGVLVTLVSPSVDTTQVFSKVTGIEADSLADRWTLWVVVSAVESQLGSYQPGETKPVYRRYKTGTVESSTDPQAIRVICQRRFIPVSEESDWVIPGLIGAIKLGIRAQMKEDADEDESADRLWQRAMMLLNAQAKSLRGGAQPQIPINNWGDGSALPYGN